MNDYDQTLAAAMKEWLQTVLQSSFAQENAFSHLTKAVEVPSMGVCWAMVNISFKGARLWDVVEIPIAISQRRIPSEEVRET